MSIATVRAAAAAKALTITGMVSAPVAVPNKLNAADLPCMVVFAGPATWSHETFGIAGETARRSYFLRFYVAPIIAGIPGEKYAEAEVLLQRAGKAFLAATDLEGSIFHDWSVTDGGIVENLAYGPPSNEQAYLGFVLTLSAQTWE
jgi:hypothetical protein